MSRDWRLGAATRAVGPLPACGLLCLLSGVLLGLSSRYGPEVTAHATQARQFDAGLPVPLEVGQLIFPPIVSPTALLLAMVLAVFKPWGRIRRSGRPGTR